jgi:hypothetical protein
MNVKHISPDTAAKSGSAAETQWLARHIDRYTVAFDRRLDAPVERVWRALTVQAETDQWWWKTDIELREGGKYAFGGWDGVVSDYEPPHTVQFDRGPAGFTRLELNSDDDGTMYTLIDRNNPELVLDDPPGGPGTHGPGILACWHGGVDDLQNYIEGTSSGLGFERLITLYTTLVTDYFADYTE